MMGSLAPLKALGALKKKPRVISAFRALTISSPCALKLIGNAISLLGQGTGVSTRTELIGRCAPRAVSSAERCAAKSAISRFIPTGGNSFGWICAAAVTSMINSPRTTPTRPPLKRTNFISTSPQGRECWAVPSRRGGLDFGLVGLLGCRPRDQHNRDDGHHEQR